MRFFKSKAIRELDGIIADIDINLANNYKSVAHEKRLLLGKRLEELNASGALKEKDYRSYRARFETYTQVMKDYHH